MKPEGDFQQATYAVVARIPKGRVMTYGQIAALCGHPRAARVVGQIAHFGPEYLPWHRVVKKDGQLASGYSYGGKEAHRRSLETEGVVVIDDKIESIDKYIWWPAG